MNEKKPLTHEITEDVALKIKKIIGGNYQQAALGTIDDTGIPMVTKVIPMNYNDTIVALATPSGVGAIGVIRVSGNNAISISNNLFKPLNNKSLLDQPTHTIHLGHIYDDDRALDEVLLSIFKDPKSYTGENVVEVSCHGSHYIQSEIIQLFIRNGCRAANPGEFTLRAFLNGKMDLSQAEAVADLIASDSESSHKIALQQMRGGFSNKIKELRDELIDFASLIELELDFSGEDVDKKIHVLSGGERNRLALCKLLLQPFNVLIMDEPTNHLDILSKNILKEALKKFEGTLILVSHDRDFLQGLCEKVIAFKDHKVKPFLGDLNSYLEDQKLSSIKELEKKSKNSNSQNGNETKKSFIEHKKNREVIKKVKKIENQIAQLEKEIKDIDFDLEVDYEKTIREPNFFDIYQAKKNKLKDLIDEWEAIQIK